ncbi:MAG: ISAs1 family transposase [Eubacterium sp.]|nr:ISAs1 family transposase [Eubacterium sp.]
MKIEKLKTEIGKEIKDPRRQYGNILHKLEDIIIIGLCATICGGKSYAEMEDFGKEREEWLREFLELPHGIPGDDTFERVFEAINPQELSNCLWNWLEAEWEERSVIAIDGKTIRGSANKKHKAYHVVSAFVAENQLTFGEITVEEKSNEITAVPELLDMLDVETAIITADAMSCQKNIVSKIVDSKADYAIALKENQPKLHKNVIKHFEKIDFTKLQFAETFDNGHGRCEHREYYLETDLKWLDKADEWRNLKSIGIAKSTVTVNDKTSEFTRYFITSLTDVNEFAYAIRKHWSIENQLHWCLDVIFREDASRARKDNSPLNLNIFRKVALTLIKNIKTGRISLNRLMFKAALNTSLLEKILFSPLK